MESFDIFFEVNLDKLLEEQPSSVVTYEYKHILVVLDLYPVKKATWLNFHT